MVKKDICGGTARPIPPGKWRGIHHHHAGDRHHPPEVDEERDGIEPRQTADRELDDQEVVVPGMRTDHHRQHGKEMYRYQTPHVSHPHLYHRHISVTIKA